MSNPTSQEHQLEELVAILDSKLFKALSEPVRIQILKFLIRNGRSDIAAIAKPLPQDRSVVSRHLNVMLEAGLVSCEKRSRQVFYEINGGLLVDKLEGIVDQIKKCMASCCPPG